MADDRGPARATRPAAGLVGQGRDQRTHRLLHFIDLPTINSVSRDSKRRTLLWKALNFSILDTIGNLPVGIPSENDAVKFCMTEIWRCPRWRPGGRDQALQHPTRRPREGSPAGAGDCAEWTPGRYAAHQGLSAGYVGAAPRVGGYGVGRHCQRATLMLAMTDLVWEASSRVTSSFPR